MYEPYAVNYMRTKRAGTAQRGNLQESNQTVHISRTISTLVARLLVMESTRKVLVTPIQTTPVRMVWSRQKTTATLMTSMAVSWIRTAKAAVMISTPKTRSKRSSSTP